MAVLSHRGKRQTSGQADCGITLGYQGEPTFILAPMGQGEAGHEPHQGEPVLASIATQGEVGAPVPVAPVHATALGLRPRACRPCRPWPRRAGATCEAPPSPALAALMPPPIARAFARPAGSPTSRSIPASAQPPSAGLSGASGRHPGVAAAWRTARYLGRDGPAAPATM